MFQISLLKVHSSDSLSHMNCLHLFQLLTLFFKAIHVFSSDFLKPPQCKLPASFGFCGRRSVLPLIYAGQLTGAQSKEKVVESKRNVDQRKVKNPLSKRSDPSKSGGMRGEEEDDQKQLVRGVTQSRSLAKGRKSIKWGGSRDLGRGM